MEVDVLGRLLEGPTAVGDLVCPRTLRTKLKLSGASKRGQSATYGAPERLLLSLFYPTKTSNDSTPNNKQQTFLFCFDIILTVAT